MGQTLLSITFCAPVQLRMRAVVKRSNARATSKLPSVKAARMVQAESDGELNVMRMALCNARVTRFVEQPCEIIYLEDDTTHSHIPDLLVFLADGTQELWEVKCSADITPDLKQRAAFLDSALSPKGYRYCLIVAEEYEVQPTLRNWCVIIYFAYRATTLLERESVRSHCKTHGFISWAEAYKGVFGRFGRQILCRLFVDGILDCDLSQPFGLESRFCLREGH
jgi:hypothetical protein